ncbi:hypothetical protein AQUCO_03000030v1 [Aquilegia coerulea]|uniref:Uncharacterized protein n=1 Tax=Aquilegia coerulea TaxID=218851 RepID=A0A2G5D0Y6_AQUCA|nr:hypothetical protein AQUCO_03000030v1 [Aquilegia coerulea]
MEYPRSPSLNWTYYYQGKNMEELRHSLFCTTLELETTRLAAQEEIKKREDQLIHLRDLLNKTISERDEAQEKCQRHFMDKLILFQQLQQQNQIQTTPLSGSGVSSIDDETRRGGDSNNGISSSDCEESIVSSPVVVDPFTSPSMVQLVQEKPLPEKGKLLQAVMKAGPLLQTLLLAGPLPQWRHPPPPLDSFEIPPVAIPPPPPSLPTMNQDSAININSNNSSNKPNNCGSFNKKRNLLVYEGSHSSNQRVLL